jgi:hypothetical protein
MILLDTNLLTRITRSHCAASDELNASYPFLAPHYAQAA